MSEAHADLFLRHAEYERAVQAVAAMTDTDPEYVREAVRAYAAASGLDSFESAERVRDHVEKVADV